MSVEGEAGELKFVDIAGTDELPPGERIFVDIGTQAVVVFNIGGQIFAVGDVCTHDHGPLGDGDLDEHEIICPRHGARFDVRDGRATRRPAVTPAPAYPVRVREGRIEIGVK